MGQNCFNGQEQIIIHMGQPGQTLGHTLIAVTKQRVGRVLQAPAPHQLSSWSPAQHGTVHPGQGTRNLPQSLGKYPWISCVSVLMPCHPQLVAQSCQGHWP